MLPYVGHIYYLEWGRVPGRGQEWDGRRSCVGFDDLVFGNLTIQEDGTFEADLATDCVSSVRGLVAGPGPTYYLLIQGGSGCDGYPGNEWARERYSGMRIWPEDPEGLVIYYPSRAYAYREPGGTCWGPWGGCRYGSEGEGIEDVPVELHYYRWGLGGIWQGRYPGCRDSRGEPIWPAPDPGLYRATAGRLEPAAGAATGGAGSDETCSGWPGLEGLETVEISNPADCQWQCQMSSWEGCNLTFWRPAGATSQEWALLDGCSPPFRLMSRGDDQEFSTLMAFMTPVGSGFEARFVDSQAWTSPPPCADPWGPLPAGATLRPTEVVVSYQRVE